MLELFRERLRRNEPLSSPIPPPPGGNAAMVGKVVTAPSALGQFFTVNPVTVTGAETAGGAGAFAVETGSTVLVYLAGSQIPSAGDLLVCRFVDYRWVAELPRGGACALRVVASGLCGAIVGAAVTVFKNAATGGAFLDPASNDTTVASGTTNSSGEYTVSVAIGVYMVRIVATGYTTVYKLVYACTSCVESFPKLALGQTVSADTGGYVTTLTGVIVSDNIRTTDPDYANEIGPFYCGPDPLNGSLPSRVSYGHFLLPVASRRSFYRSYYGPYVCDGVDATGTDVAFEMGCSQATGVLAIFYIVTIFADPQTGVLYYLYPGSDLCVGMTYTQLVVKGTIKEISLSPFAVRGTWEPCYSIWANSGSGVSAGSNGVAPDCEPINRYSPSPNLYDLNVLFPPPITGAFAVT